ncbi:MAG TPA: efflux RND transporter periplasmic adaptor subunit [Thermoanaerobaculia bacterium]|nr:efflux RND transporter periplasmic adaptor subunit [Thermoanaerobaculia bacterium]
MTIRTEPTSGAGKAGLALVLLAALTGCATPSGEVASEGGESWSVTAWGERFEVFPEVDALAVDETATAHTHVTRLEGFEPLTSGEVSIVLSGPGGQQVFTADEPTRPGIFAVEITPERAGEYDLSFRIRDESGGEEIRGGRVRVGTAERPGALLRAPAPKGGSDGGEPLSFLKEQQWRSDFGTAWVRPGALAASVAGLATVRPPAGGEATITAPVDGVVQPPPGALSWPFVGLVVGRGQPLFRVSPLVASDRSLPALEAELASLETELETARARLARLEELLALEAASRREVEEARARVETLGARRSAASRDLEAARSARGGGASANDLVLRAPFAGEVARVSASPGTTVKAGDALARLVGSDAVWIEVEVPPSGARRLAAEGVRGVVLSDPEHGPLRLEEGVRPISIAPEVSPETGTVTVLLEAPRGSGPALGTTVEAQVLSAAPLEGIVIPSSALVDDGGVPVVYLQLSGESFVRQEVRVLERQGDRILVDHLVPGQRLVTRGGDAIRRASLMASGEVHGHVH